MMGSFNSGENRAANLSPYSSDTPPPTSFSFKTDTVLNTPPPLFTHPSEANRLQFEGFHSLSRKDSGIDKQPGDNPIEFSLNSFVPLPVCRSVHTGKKAIQPALEVFTLFSS